MNLAYPRCKLEQLTLINWNGYFARSLELDPQVTALSGGNGAGKSTLMAALLVALVPDLNLLNFRNTTEAGSGRALKDRGIAGKLGPGLSYALFRAQSGSHRFLAGISLKCLGAREGKLELQPFVVPNWPEGLEATHAFTEPLESEQALSQVVELPLVAERLKAEHGLLLKRCPSIGDYHQQLFLLGMLQKPFRQSSERTKLYRLLEASLYGGISTTIVQALKEYLLTEPVGVKRAFQELESAVQENRLTLLALEETEKSRTLFKSLLGHTSTYVASEYMRHCNRLKSELQSLQALRAEIACLSASVQSGKAALQDQSLLIQATSARRQRLQKLLETEHQRRDRAETALRQLERMAQVEERILALKNAHRQSSQAQLEAEKASQAAAQKVKAHRQWQEELQSSLAHQALMLDQHQKQKLQRDQAWQAWDKACLQGHVKFQAKPLEAGFPEAVEKGCTEAAQNLQAALQAEQASMEAWQHQNWHHQRLNEALEKLAQVRDAAREAGISEESHLLPASQWKALEGLFKNQRNLASQRESLTLEAQQLRSRWEQAQRRHLALEAWWKRWLPERVAPSWWSPEALVDTHLEWKRRVEALTEKCEAQARQRELCFEAQAQKEAQVQALEQGVRAWQAAQEAALGVQERFGVQWDNLETFQKRLEKEREKVSEKRTVLATLTLEMQHLQSELSGVQESLSTHALKTSEELETQPLGAVSLQQWLEGVQLEHSPLCSAVLEPFRHAWVVEAPEVLRTTLPSDEPWMLLSKAFVEKMSPPRNLGVHYEKGERGVWVEEGLGAWRYTPYPTTPWVGSASQAQRRAELQEQQQTLQASLTAEQQALAYGERLIAAMESLLTQHGAVAFGENLAAVLTRLKSELQSAQNIQKAESETLKHLQGALKSSLQASQSLEGLLEGAPEQRPEGIQEAWEKVQAQQEQSEAAQRWLHRWASKVEAALEVPLWSLESPPSEESLRNLEKQCQAATTATQQWRTEQWVWLDLKARLAHFGYGQGREGEEGQPMQAEHEALKGQLQTLRLALEPLLTEHQAAKRNLERCREQTMQWTAELQGQQSLLEAHRSDWAPLQAELNLKGAELTPTALQSWMKRQSWLQIQADLEQEQNQLEKHIEQRSRWEAELDHHTQKWLERRNAYRLWRSQALQLHQAWNAIRQSLKKEARASNLYRPAWTQLSEEALRRQADEALGALKSSSCCPPELRRRLDDLETRNLSHLVHFYQLVLEYLQDRIRHDLFHHANPLQALERMESELQRLKKDLKERESKLRVRSQSVAQLIHKAVQREQLRMEQLNQGLESRRFGAIQAIRVQLKVKAAHEHLLRAMLDPEATPHLWGELRGGNSEAPVHFFEQLGALYQRLAPGVTHSREKGWSTHQWGESLLDYRNYLQLTIEVQRKGSGWIEAESGLLSTGEAIGVGMSMLMMVIQSWEEEGRRLRSHHRPFRFLMLDEAARLDSHSMTTLSELCTGLELQLLLAAPEGSTSVAGTTYHLHRQSLPNGKAHVAVVGFRKTAQTSTPLEIKPV